MKRLLYCLLAWIATGLPVACSPAAKEKAGDQTFVAPDSVEAEGAQRMQVSDVTTPIDYCGKEYVSSVHRQPDESLPPVADGEGGTFVDNRISLRLTCGGHTVFEKVFTKEMFARVVDTEFLKRSVLEGLVFDRTSPEGFVYAASVCFPQTDLYIPLRITVTLDGRMMVVQEDLMEDPYRDDEKPGQP